MGSETIFAAVALIVSLIALAISSFQLLMSLFGTAEGYRKCAESTIGPWSDLKRRVMQWGEMRFEVHYTTPHFAIISATVDARESQERNYEFTRFLKLPNYDTDNEPLNTRTLQFIPKRLRLCRLYLKAWVGIEDYPTDDEKEMVLRQTITKPDTSIPSNHLRDHEKGLALQPMVTKPNSSKSNNKEIVVSWIPLTLCLGELYDRLNKGSYINSYNSRKKHLHSLDIPSYTINPSTSTNPVPEFFSTSSNDRAQIALPAIPSGSPESAHVSQTHIAVSMRRWKWEFMPSDLPKPLATSTLNQVILIGLRLNMQWWQLEVKRGIFNADGNGYSLTSYEIRGLGIGFRFTAANERDWVKRECVPSRDVDKMMFGIIPGERNPLVLRDFHLVREQKVDYQWFFEQLEFNPKTAAKLTSEHNEPRNEVMTLLCPFLPLRGSLTFCNFFPAWVARGISCFHWWEGREAFLWGIRKRRDGLAGRQTAAADTYQYVLDCMNYLEEFFAADFYDRWLNSKLEKGSSQDHQNLQEILRNLFDTTTEYFQGQRCASFEWNKVPSETRTNSEVSTFYVDLVAAHGEMSFQAVSAYAKLGKDKSIKKWNPTPNIKGLNSFSSLIVLEYLQRVEPGVVDGDSTKGVVEAESLLKCYRARGNTEPEDSQVLAAWWVLMLRGIVWDMSTQGDPWVTGRAPRWEGTPVDSSLYRNETPVWIT